MKQVVRIIGGLYKGKKLYFPEVEGLRPTPNRIRETLFNWLMNEIRGARCLDAFAGSGALGLEAFSRGATSVTFIEQSSKAFVALKKNLNEFNHASLRLIQADTLSYLQNTMDEFDIVFLDPPFAKNYAPECLNILIKKKILSKEGLVYVESAHVLETDLKAWEQLKLKQAGQVFYGLIKKV